MQWDYCEMNLKNYCYNRKMARKALYRMIRSKTKQSRNFWGLVCASYSFAAWKSLQ